MDVADGAPILMSHYYLSSMIGDSSEKKASFWRVRSKSNQKVSQESFILLLSIGKKRINLIILHFELVYFGDSCLIPHLLLLDWTNWIDVCQSNGNLLAAGGDDKNVKIFDKRESKIVRTFYGIHRSNILLMYDFWIFIVIL